VISLSPRQQRLYDAIELSGLGVDAHISALYTAVWGAAPTGTPRSTQMSLGPVISHVNARLRRQSVMSGETAFLQIEPGDLKRTYRLVVVVE
jgi:hypothetical protein